MKQVLSTAGVAIILFIGLSWGTAANVTAGQPPNPPGQYGGSLDARQHGYEHAYRDGADRGRQDREAKRGYTLKDNDYLSGARGYERAFGDKTVYMQGYRDGYKIGYDDGYKGNAGQYGQLYAHPQYPVRPPPPEADPYAGRAYSSTDMAFDAGYREGITRGQQDHSHNARSDFRSDNDYRSGDLGYRSSYGDRGAYQTQFRDGFERGYEDGFGRMPNASSGRSSNGGRYDAGSNNGGRNGGGRYNVGQNNGGQNNGARNGQGAAGGTFTVPANVQWTPTGIRVTQGETLRFTSTGEIHFTGNAADVAGVAGSLQHKLVPGSPLPAALAGALIGRIDNGPAFGIGNQTTIIAPASGLLYLGTNDDNVSDNGGQFQVVISR